MFGAIRSGFSLQNGSLIWCRWNNEPRHDMMKSNRWGPATSAPPPPQASGKIPLCILLFLSFYILVYRHRKAVSAY